MNWVGFFEKVTSWVFPLAALWAVVVEPLFPNSISQTVEMVCLAAVVLVLGLPHGALDPWIAKSLKFRAWSWHPYSFNAIYLSLSLIVIVAWIFFPAACLVIFLAISSWHFSSDWENSLPWFWRKYLGILLLLMPIGFHTQEAGMLFWHLSGDGGTAVADALALPAWSLAILSLAVFLAAVSQRGWSLSLEILTLCVLAWSASPLIYFTLYFCLLHSPRHTANIFLRVTPSEHLKLIKIMILYTGLALLGLGLMSMLWVTASLDTIVMRVVFVGLAALTVPHMMLIFAQYVQDRY